ncbi:MAG: TonB-dependent receptor, partial [Cyclobacteriaceae bacterium]
MVVRNGNGQSCFFEGVVRDTNDSTIQFVSVVAYKANNQLETYTTTNSKGYFRLALECDKTYKLELSHLSYVKDSAVVTTDRQLISRQFLMIDKSLMLGDVTIEETIPVNVRGDTTEFNVGSYTNGNEEVLEDLVKKLPGLKINNNGDITYQGEKIDNVMVEGKEFFGGNTKLATKNIPADVVDKIQLIESSSFNLAETKKKALNIILDEDKKSLFFGEMLAGSNFDDRHEVQNKSFYFSKEFDISFIGNYNNLNKTLFTFEDYLELFGGLESILEGDDQALQFSFNDLGINSIPKDYINDIASKTVSLNTNYAPNGKNWSVNAFGIYTSSAPELSSTENRTFSSQDNIRTEEETFLNNQLYESLIFNATYKNQISPNTSLNYKPNFKRIALSEQSERSLNVFDNTQNRFTDNGRLTNSFDHRLVLKHQFNKKSDLKISGSQLVKTGDANYNLSSDQRLFPSLFTDNENLGSLLQLQDNDQRMFSLKSIFVRKLNLKSQLAIEAGYQNNSDALTSALVTEENNSINNDVKYQVSDLFTGLIYARKINKTDVRLGLSVHKFDINSRSGTELTDTRWQVLPSVDIKKNFGKAHFLRSVYRKKVVFPTANQISENPIVTNYRTLAFGMGTLNEAIYHQFSLSYFRLSLWNHYTITVNINHDRKIDEFRPEVFIDSTGVQQTTMTNNQPESSSSVVLRFEKDFKKVTLKLKSDIFLLDFNNTLNDFTNSNNSLISNNELGIS